jgi:hypothetical protein
MMKIALISLFLCLSVFGQFGIQSPEFVSKLSQKAVSSASDVPAGSLLSEDFEGTGAINFGRQLWGDGTIPLAAKKPRGTLTVSGTVTFN